MASGVRGAATAYDSRAHGFGSCKTTMSASIRRKCEMRPGETGTDPALPHVPTRVTGTPSTVSAYVDAAELNASTWLSSRPLADVHKDRTTRSIPPAAGG